MNGAPPSGSSDPGEPTMQQRIDAAAEELYGVPPEEFVPARDELVAQARQAGDRDAARAIGLLRRPTQAAWLANLLARERADELDGLLDLADALSSAQRTLDGTQLRQLSAQRSKLVAAMAREARRLAAAGGHRVTESVERDLRGILDAALADPEVADEVTAGRLTRTVSRSGFGFGDEPGAGGGPGPESSGRTVRRRPVRTRRVPPGTDADRPDTAVPGGSRAPDQAGQGPDIQRERTERERAEREARARAAAEAERAAAATAAASAADAHEDAVAELRAAETDRDDAGARMEQLTAELEHARAVRTAAVAAVKAAGQAEREAARAARDAAAALDRAAARLAELEERD